MAHVWVGDERVDKYGLKVRKRERERKKDRKRERERGG
jgi:hypothetical protein